jgi:hypothetical protein
MNYLLKTFSINPFQGQYPNMAVRMTTSPMGPRIHRETPEVKKAAMINIIPAVNLKIPSPFPIFLVFTADFPSSNSRGTDRFGARHGQSSFSLVTFLFQPANPQSDLPHVAIQGRASYHAPYLGKSRPLYHKLAL